MPDLSTLLQQHVEHLSQAPVRRLRRRTGKGPQAHPAAGRLRHRGGAGGRRGRRHRRRHVQQRQAGAGPPVPQRDGVDHDRAGSRAHPERQGGDPRPDALADDVDHRVRHDASRSTTSRSTCTSRADAGRLADARALPEHRRRHEPRPGRHLHHERQGLRQLRRPAADQGSGRGLPLAPERQGRRPAPEPGRRDRRDDLRGRARDRRPGTPDLAHLAADVGQDGRPATSTCPAFQGASPDALWLVFGRGGYMAETGCDAVQGEAVTSGDFLDLAGLTPVALGKCSGSAKALKLALVAGVPAARQRGTGDMDHLRRDAGAACHEHGADVHRQGTGVRAGGDPASASAPAS